MVNLTRDELELLKSLVESENMRMNSYRKQILDEKLCDKLETRNRRLAEKLFKELEKMPQRQA